jgi:hypothetical protein
VRPRGDVDLIATIDDVVRDRATVSVWRRPLCMRFVVVLCCACSTPAASRPGPIANRAVVLCDPAGWHLAVRGDWHARLPGRPRALAVVSREGPNLTVADEVSGAILVRRIPASAFERVVARVAPLSREASGTDFVAWAEPGASAHNTKERAVFIRGVSPIEASGWASADDIDVAWHDTPSLKPLRRLAHDAEVRVARDKDAELVARIRGGLPVELMTLSEDASGWRGIATRDEQIYVIGLVYVASDPFDGPSPPDPPAPASATDPPPSPDLCIRAEPEDGADALGILTAPLAPPHASGWSRVELDAAWGHVTGFVHRPLPDMGLWSRPVQRRTVTSHSGPKNIVY